MRIQTQDKVGNKATWSTLYILMYNSSLNDNDDNSECLPGENLNPITTDDDNNDEELKKEISGYEIYLIIGIIIVVLSEKIIKIVKK